MFFISVRRGGDLNSHIPKETGYLGMAPLRSTMFQSCAVPGCATAAYPTGKPQVVYKGFFWPEKDRNHLKDT